MSRPKFGSRSRVILGATIAVSGLVAATPAIAAPAVTAAYSATIGGPGHAAMYPSGMEIAPNGNIIVADTGNDQVAEYTSTGTLVWRIGSEGSAAPCGSNPTGFPQFEQPRDVGVDSAGNVYVADNGNGRVVKLNGANGKCLLNPFKVPGGGAPIGITVSTTPAGELVYVANGTKSQVNVFNTSGGVVRTISSKGACVLNRMRDAAADASGNVYVANYESNNILEFSSTGSCIHSWGTKGSGNSQFMNPYGVAIGTDPFINGGSPGEAIYVADSNNDRIQEFTPTGAYVAQMGTAGTDSQTGTFTQLRRVAVDSHGNVWGADLWGYRVEEFTRSSSGYTYSQTIPNPIVPPGNTSTSVFNQVRGISFDASGDVVAMDSVNQRVDVFTSGGTLVNTCGQRGFSSTGDFNWPRGVAVDPTTGNYWIADTKQSDLQVLHPTASGCNGLAKFGVVGTALGDDNYPSSIAIGSGYAWIADTRNNRVESWNVSTQKAVSTYGTKGSGAGQFSMPTGVGIDPSTGNLFVADSLNNRVVELKVSGGHVSSTVATFTSGFNKPYGAASNGSGLLAVADRTNNRVVVLNESDGTVAAIINGSDVTGGGPKSLFDPENVAFGTNGKLYIADTYNDRILVYTLA
ncbi:MAG: NHL repeat-containing protein [Candidatus Dormibacteria bacterium]